MSRQGEYQILGDLGYKEIERHIVHIQDDADFVYKAEINGLQVMGDLNTLSFLARTFSQNREEDLVARSEQTSGELAFQFKK